jgi:acyl-ACP thioesterase
MHDDTDLSKFLRVKNSMTLSTTAIYHNGVKLSLMIIKVFEHMQNAQYYTLDMQ